MTSGAQLPIQVATLQLFWAAFLGGQNQPAPQAETARLAGCYAVTWGEEIGTWDGPQLPHTIQLTTQPFKVLGWHRVGFYQVLPERLADGSYTIWRVRGADSLEVELMASPVPGTFPAFFMLARVASDTLRGSLGLLRPSPGEPLPAPLSLVPFVPFIAARKTCT